MTSRKEINAALLSLKMLGRSLPASVIISERNVWIYFMCMCMRTQGTYILSSKNFHILLKVMKSLYKSNTDAAYDALRCVANALLLVEESRDTWARVQGADYCMELLEVNYIIIRSIYIHNFTHLYRKLNHLFAYSFVHAYCSCVQSHHRPNC